MIMLSKSVPVCSNGPKEVPTVSPRALRGRGKATRISCLPPAAHIKGGPAVDAMTSQCTPASSTTPLASVAVTTAAALLMQLSAPMSMHDAALARAILTPDEKVAIDVYKKAKPSVVNVTNMSIRRCVIADDLFCLTYFTINYVWEEVVLPRQEFTWHPSITHDIHSF